jgi:hypothetical protein
MALKQMKDYFNGRLTSRLAKFYNLHEGESCYIFGDGPSIKWFDLTCFNDLPSICCNMIPFHRDYSKLRIKYVSMTSPWIFVRECMRPDVKALRGFTEVMREYKAILRSNPDKQYFVHISNCVSLRGKNINYVYRGLPSIRNDKDVLINRKDLFSGAFQSTLSLACYMGFSKVYLVGFDAWTIQPGKNMHWYEYGEGELFEPTNLAMEFLGALKNRMELYTITPSALDISKNVIAINYKEYTGKSVKYTENTSLLTSNNLEILASYPGYKIMPS